MERIDVGRVGIANKSLIDGIYCSTLERILGFICCFRPFHYLIFSLSLLKYNQKTPRASRTVFRNCTTKGLRMLEAFECRGVDGDNKIDRKI